MLRRLESSVVLKWIPRRSSGTCGACFIFPGHHRLTSCGSCDVQMSSRVSSLQSTVQRRFICTRSRAMRQSWARNAMRPWMCPSESCRVVNPAVKPTCEACGTEKPKLQGWKCVKCETRNHRGVKLCKSCKEPFTSSQEFWMCAVCEGNNRIDELDDNSRCGFCGYDMAPLSLTEERLAEMNEQREAEFQAQQERFDSVSAHDADEQYGDAQFGADALPERLRQGHQDRNTASTSAPRSDKALASMPPVKPFSPPPTQTRHSRIYNRRSVRSAVSPIAAAAAVGAVGVVSGNAVPPGPPGFDWMCREPQCGQVNPGDEENCLSCGKHIAPAEWECPQCAALNHLSRSRCFHCNAGIPAFWTCPACGTNTSIYDAVCRQCQEARPAVEPRSVGDVLAQERDAAAMNSQLGGPALTFRKNDWYCTSCNGLNFSRRSECYQCGTPRASSAHRASTPSTHGQRPDWTQGDEPPSSRHQRQGFAEQNNWVCRQCQASNFRTRSSCWQCGKESESVGAHGLAEGDENMPHFDREGFQDSAESKPAEGRMNTWKKTDDWVCAKCFSKNHRGRSECYKCGAPRSLAVAPRRASVRKPAKL